MHCRFIARALLTHTSWVPTVQQLGLDASFWQSEACAQMCKVSVPWQVALAVSTVLQSFAHRDARDWTTQLGA
jgi:hypothetical protein